MDVRVDGGPQDGTILVTWIPSSGQGVAQRQAPVTGYAVFADGKRVTDVDSPTSKKIENLLNIVKYFKFKFFV
jgi:RIMS-binding protein 2